MSSFLWVLYILHIVRSVIQGMGNTVIPLVSGIFEFIMRTGATLILPVLFGENGILFAEVLAWMGADLVLIPGYLYMRKSCFRADRTRVMFKAQFEVLRKRKPALRREVPVGSSCAAGLVFLSAGSAGSSLRSPQFCPQIP